MRAATAGVLGAIAGGELSQAGLREELPGELEGSVLLLVQVVADLGRQLASELAELIRRRVHAPQLLDELLGLVMIRERVTTARRPASIMSSGTYRWRSSAVAWASSSLARARKAARRLSADARPCVIVRASERCTSWLARRSSKIVMAFARLWAARWRRTGPRATGAPHCSQHRRTAARRVHRQIGASWMGVERQRSTVLREDRVVWQLTLSIVLLGAMMAFLAGYAFC